MKRTVDDARDRPMSTFRDSRDGGHVMSSLTFDFVVVYCLCRVPYHTKMRTRSHRGSRHPLLSKQPFTAKMQSTIVSLLRAVFDDD